VAAARLIGLPAARGPIILAAMKSLNLLIPACAAILLLAGCASSGGPPRVARPDSGGTEPSLATPRPQQQRADAVMGRNAASLIALFGQPALDVQEGIARKLQFSGRNCVLDAYLYPPRDRAEPIVTHVDARSADGRDADRTACVAALRR
jgi:hypothetical protein